MVIFLYNPYIFGIHLWTLLYPKLCYNEPCYKKVNAYVADLGVKLATLDLQLDKLQTAL